MSGALARIVDQSASSHPEDARHILADSSLTDQPIRVLKHGDTFALFDQYGDIRPGKDGEQGIYRDGRVYLSLGSLHLGLRKFLWLGACYQELRIENHGNQLTDVDIALQFAADFADIYEVRGLKRQARGVDLDPEAGD